MSAIVKETCVELSPELQKEIQENFYWVSDPNIAWEIGKTFSPEEHQRVGDIYEAIAKRGTIGMYRVAKKINCDLRALVKIAEDHGYTKLKLANLKRALPDEVEEQSFISKPKPEWNCDRGILYFEQKVIRVVDKPGVALNIVKILDAFEDSSWPDRIDDPLPGPANTERLGNAVRRLNDGLTSIRFRRDGTATGILWERVNATQ